MSSLDTPAQRAAALARFRRKLRAGGQLAPAALVAVVILDDDGHIVEIISPFWTENAARAWLRDMPHVDPDRCLLVPARFPSVAI